MLKTRVEWERYFAEKITYEQYLQEIQRKKVDEMIGPKTVLAKMWGANKKGIDDE